MIQKTAHATEMSTEKLKSILREFRRHGGVKVDFFGGEPLLRRDVVELVAEATALGLSSTLSTNGIRFTEDVALSLKEAGLCAVEVSLDTADPERFVQMRQFKNIFEKTHEAVLTAHWVGLPISVSTYAYRENLLGGGLRDVIELARSWKIRSVRILEPITAGKWGGELQERLQPDERAKLSDFLIPGFVHSENQGRGFDHHCSALDGDLLYVTPSGVVYPCCFLHVPLGDLSRDSFLQAIRQRNNLTPFRKKIIGCPSNDPRFRALFHLDE